MAFALSRAHPCRVKKDVEPRLSRKIEGQTFFRLVAAWWLRAGSQKKGTGSGAILIQCVEKGRKTLGSMEDMPSSGWSPNAAIMGHDTDNNKKFIGNTGRSNRFPFLTPDMWLI